MFGTLRFLSDLNHGEKALVIGYTPTSSLSFLLVYFGIRSYRDNLANGAITFGRAFTIGICITLISCVFYVVSWEIIYFNFIPHFMDNYFACPDPESPILPGTAEAIQAKVAAIHRQSQQSYFRIP